MSLKNRERSRELASLLKKTKRKEKSQANIVKVFSGQTYYTICCWLELFMKSLCSFGVISSTLMFWQMGGIVAICLYFSNPSTGRCKMGTVGTPYTANSILSPKCLLFICPDPQWGRRLAQVSGWCLPALWLLGKGRAGPGWRDLCMCSFCWKHAVSGIWGSWTKSLSAGAFFLLSITSLFSVPSPGIGSRDWRGIGWSDHGIFLFCDRTGG